MDARVAEPQTRWVEVTGSKNAKLATECMGSGQPFIWGHGLLGSMAQDLDGWKVSGLCCISIQRKSKPALAIAQ